MDIRMRKGDMDIYFSKKALQQYSRSMAAIHSSPLRDLDLDGLKEGKLVKVDELERHIKKRGAFFSKGNKSFVCIVGNLHVYEGRFTDATRVEIDSAYAYEGRVKKRLRNKEKINFLG